MNDPSSERLVSDDDIHKLSEGLLSIYKEPFTKVADNLKELTSKQTKLINSMAAHNEKTQSFQNNPDVKKMIADIAYCREQLIDIKKQMTSIHERSSRLKIRAQNVVTFAKNKQMSRLAQLEHEQRLIGGRKS